MNYIQKLYSLFLTFFAKYWFMLLAFVLPIKSVFISIYILLFIDFITGIWASVKQEQTITSKRMRDSINKIIAYTITVLGVLLLEQRLLQGFPLVSFIGCFVGIVEAYSICENLYKATELPIFKNLMSITSLGRSVAVQKAIDYLKSFKNKNEE